jgi:hypothetical protein
MFVACAAAQEPQPIVREAVPYTTVVTLTNPHDRAVKIERLDATCSCAKTPLTKDFLLPHESTTLNVEIDNKNRSGPQTIGITAFVTDPELEPLEASIEWIVRASVQVDAIYPGMDTLQRPDGVQFHDVYRYGQTCRPDEPNKLAKMFRLSCPPEEEPEGGLKVESISYDGAIWKFTWSKQSNGSILVRAAARDLEHDLPDGLFQEQVVIHTNHPDKSAIELNFVAKITKDAGSTALDLDSLPEPQR